MKNKILIAVSFLVMGTVNAQLISINTQVSIMPGTLVSAIGGDVVVQVDGILTNEGEFHIQGDFQNEGETQAWDLSEFVVKGNWINYGDFTAFGGDVVLDSANQFIMGSAVSNFHHLTLLNGIKTQTLDVTTFSLNLEDTHLSTSYFVFEITSADTDALQTDGSWIDSDAGGQLIRATNSTDEYVYPVGSVIEEDRSRWVFVSPKNSNPNKVGIRMVNHNATDDGFDAYQKDEAINEVNQLYYHLIEQIEGESDFDLTFQYAASDIDAETVAHWNSDWDQQFNTTGENESGTLTALNVSDFTSIAFALAALNSLVYLPNAFTPDDDGINDTFFMVCDDYDDIKNFEFKLYNRWGQQIFETTDPHFQWTGGKEYYAETDAFNWTMKYNPKGAEQPIEKSGHVMILR
jgi:gliding motility-associated-like protein